MASPGAYRPAIRGRERVGHFRRQHPWTPRQIGPGLGSKDRFRIGSPNSSVSRMPTWPIGATRGEGDASTNRDTRVGADSGTGDHDNLLRLEQRVRKLLQQKRGLWGYMNSRHLMGWTDLQLEELGRGECYAPDVHIWTD